jgi:lipoate-protein ligase A
MLKLNLDLSDLEQKSSNMVKVIDSKIAELEEEAPQLGVREYINRLSEEFKEAPFTPLDEVWEEELRRLFGQLDSKQGQDDESD